LFGAAAAPLNLGPVANNGGPTQTMALLSGSVAIDAGDNCVTDVAHCSDANIPQLTSDQRGAGYPRKVDGNGDSTATVDIGAYEAPPLPGNFQFSSATYSDSETNATHNATITVTRTNGSNGAVSVHYATSDGSATAGSDYTATSGDLNWADGDASAKTFDVSVTGDTVFESDETVTLTLSAPTGGATLGSPNTSVLTITNDDTAPTFSIDDVTHLEGDTGTTSFVFTVTRTGSTALSSQVDFTTQDGSATTGDNDYVLNTGTL